MSRLVRSKRSKARPADDSVAGHVETERREESRQNGLIRRRSRTAVRYPGQFASMDSIAGTNGEGRSGSCKARIRGRGEGDNQS